MDRGEPDLVEGRIKYVDFGTLSVEVPISGPISGDVVFEQVAEEANEQNIDGIDGITELY